MKKILVGLSVAIATGMVSCINEKIDSPDTPAPLNDAYFTVTMTQSGNTRTETGKEGSENPQADEKAINNLTLIFADQTGKVLAMSEKISESITSTDGNGNAYTMTFKVLKSNMESLSGQTNVGVYVVANVDDLYYVYNKDNINKVMSIGDTDAGKYMNASDGFLMSNANAVTIDEALPSDWSDYTKSSPYQIEDPIKLQRAMARFDVCNTVPTDENCKVNGISVNITDMYLLNLSKNFNLFKSVGDNTSGFKLFADETTTNFVHDPFAEQKEGLTTNGSFSTYFINPEASTLPKDITNWTSISSLDKPDGDFSNKTGDESNTVTSEAGGKEYQIWRYVTPSTVTDASKQLQGNMTAIVFKGELIKGTAEISGWGENNMIAFDNVVYGNLAKVKSIAESPKNTAEAALANHYNNAKKNGEDPSEEDLEKEGSFKVYKKNQDNKYFAYYYYWNRHNSGSGSAKDGVLSPMEFGVVRNNIYKLAVTKITGLGYPEDKVPDPSQAIETKEIDGYIEVSVDIVPWEVRVTDIEF